MQNVQLVNVRNLLYCDVTVTNLDRFWVMSYLTIVYVIMLEYCKTFSFFPSGI